MVFEYEFKHMNNMLKKYLTICICFFILPVNAAEIDFSGFNKVYYEMGKNTLPFLNDYQVVKKKMAAMAEENKLGRNYVDEIENDLLLALASSNKTRNSILKSITYDALSKEMITSKEKNFIDKIFYSITESNVKSAKTTLNSLKAATKTTIGKAIYSELRTLLNGTSDGANNPQTQSTTGILTGGALGSIAGGIAGGIASGGNPAGIGAGAVIGGAVGSLFGHLFSGDEKTTTTTTTTTTTNGNSTTTTTTTTSGVWLGPNGRDAEHCSGPPDLLC